MNFRDLAGQSRASGWMFKTSCGADLSVGLLSASVGEIRVLPVTADPNAPPTRLRYVALGLGLSVGDFPIGVDGSLPSMYSTGLIFSLVHRPLTPADFIGGAVVVSANLPGGLITGGPDSQSWMSYGLFFFGAPMHLTASNAVFEVQEYLPGAFGILPEVVSALSGQNYFWRSFKGFAAIAGEIRGAIQPGVTYLRGMVPSSQQIAQAEGYVHSLVRSLDPRTPSF